jgi:hypothetical protein
MTSFARSGVSEEERQEIARPHINYIGYDLYVRFHKMAMVDVHRHCRREISTIAKWDEKYMPKGLAKIEPILNDSRRFTAYLKEQVSLPFVSQDDHEKLTAIADHTGQAFDGCIKRRGYTDDCLSLLGKT